MIRPYRPRPRYTARAVAAGLATMAACSTAYTRGWPSTGFWALVGSPQYPAAATPLPCGTPPPPAPGPSGRWDAEQTATAATLVAVGQSLGVPRQGWVIATAAALVESNARNLDHGDRDSLGILQQRPSQGWGSPDQVRDPVHAAHAFYVGAGTNRGLTEIEGWADLPLTAAAQAVQRSAYPDRYGTRAADAEQLVAAVEAAANPVELCAPPPDSTGGGLASPLDPMPPIREHGRYPAIDLPVPAGTPVRSLTSGQGRTLTNDRCGTGVTVTHGDGIEVTYCHLSTATPTGDVTAGQQIGLSGWSGHVIPPGPAGAHLHVQIRAGGALRCPQPLLSALTTPGAQLPAFEELPTTIPCPT